MNKISIVMPVKNNLKMTEETIKSLIENTANLGEIIIIDDSSVEDFYAIEGTTCYLNKGEGVTDAWNYGATLAKFPVICWVNNDLLFSPNWDIPLINALNNEVWVASPYHTSFELPADFPLGGGRHGNMEAATTGLKFLGSCFMMEKKNWEKVGPIDTRLKIWCGDNYIYESVLNDFGRRCVEVPESYIHHFISKTLAPLLKTPEMNTTITEDCKNFDIIYGERRWRLNPNYPWIPSEIDLRLRLPTKNLTKMKVLNVGIGDMESGLARQLPHLKFGSLHNIDTYEPYIDKADKMGWISRVTFESKDMRDVTDYNDYDLIMVFDVFEHLKKEESIKIINSITKPLLVFGPLEKDFRHNHTEAESQEHLSLWTEQDFKDLGFETEVLVNFHESEQGRFDAIWAYREKKEV